MAPALADAPREPAHDPDTFQDADKPLPHPRRALASVDNLATHMEEDDMGLQNQPSLAKDSQEMEQILVDLGNSDLVQADLLQAIKTLESGGDALSTGDPDVIFPLSGFDLPDTVDSEGDGVEDKIKATQAHLERRTAFLQRRLRILQARAIGKRISEEAAQTFEKCTRGARRDGGGRPVGLKTFLKTIETTAALQASAASRTVVGPKYFNPGTSKGDASRSASVGIPSGTLAGLEDTAGALRSHLSVVKRELDSDATASSSGAESNDEAVTYNNPHQQQMPIEKRALWSWQRARASIASRWCWLQAQVQELEYKIRQHNDLHKQVREAKGAVEFEGSPAASPSPPGAYQGRLPGAAPAPAPDACDTCDTCARVRPLRRDTFKKRKLLQMHNLHIATNKAAKPSDIKCSCQYPEESCPVCTGRGEPTQPAPPFSTLPPQHRVAQVDPGYHPVLSHVKDISPSVHLAALSSRSWFRARVSSAAGGGSGGGGGAGGGAGREGGGRAARGAHSAGSGRAPPAPRPPKRHHTKLKRGRPPLSRKIRERERDEESTSGHERSRGRSSTESRALRRQSYDIDNIVIPQSVAANTRPQILTYKEIITPKWRVMEIPEVSLNNGVTRTNHVTMESEDEDVSEAAVAARHRRAEQRERDKYVRKQRARRDQHQQQQQQLQQQQQQQQQQQHPPAALLLPPANPAPPTTQHETVRPYTPRQFPLGEATYLAMAAGMPPGHRPASPGRRPATASRRPASPGRRPATASRRPASPGLRPATPGRRPASPRPDALSDDDSSTLSPMSPLFFEGDDPDDAEWDPSSEKIERRKSAFR